MSNNESTVDLLVLGGGMAGLSAGAKAALAGASVVLVERGDSLGGSANYAGYIWTAPDPETMLANNPDSTPELSTTLAHDFPKAIEWVKSLDVEVQDPVTVLRFGTGHQTDLAGYIRTCGRIIRDQGELLLSTITEHLIIDDGKVIGADVTLPNGDTRRIYARSTLLATGGFGGDAKLRAERIHPQARDIALRANPWSQGEGLRLAQEAGAALQKADAGFYGHLIPSQLPLDDPMDFVTLSFYHSEHSVLVNLNGERFCDETIGDHITTMKVLEQPEGRALMICDQRVHDQWMLTPYVVGANVVDRFQVAYKRGARCAVTDEIGDFIALPEEWGYPGEQVVQTLDAYNQACQAGQDHSPERAYDSEPLLTPPYYAIEVVPAITFSFEGIAIDTQARVLDADGQPIGGLLAAGADTGGVFVRAYAGGIANALIYGLRAAETAMATR
jgi:succinate dehydrogenase/fumarate reductase flavoprotein subunit